jgi:hypothetical protein
LIDILARDRPPSRLAITSQLHQLILAVLVSGAHPRVNACSHLWPPRTRSNSHTDKDSADRQSSDRVCVLGGRRECPRNTDDWGNEESGHAAAMSDGDGRSPTPPHPGSRGTGVVEFLLLRNSRQPRATAQRSLARLGPLRRARSVGVRRHWGYCRSPVLSEQLSFQKECEEGASRLLPSGPAGCWMASYAFFGQEIRRLQAKPLASAFSSF